MNENEVKQTYFMTKQGKKDYHEKTKKDTRFKRTCNKPNSP